MNKTKLLKILLILEKNSCQGISLIELLVALVIGGIALTAAASGFINLLNANQEVEAKTSGSATLTRALAYMQNDIKAANEISQVASGTDDCTDTTATTISSIECLVITVPNSFDTSDPDYIDDPAISTDDEYFIYYAYEDISNGSQTWLKPGVLKRRRVVYNNDTDSWDVGNWNVIADGLISANETQPTTSCNQDGATNWAGGTTVYGTDSNGKGGFRFCLEPTNNRLVRIFLYGHIIGNSSNDQIMVNTISFARAN
jgi:prepilin-type N-terminal cleavage/methylation domain-containing protein